MRLQVLGKSPSWPDAGGACSGYLVEHGDFRLLVDCGSGVFSKLRAVTDFRALDAILITHLHPDHMLDLVPFSFGLKYSGRPATRPQLHAPPDSRRVFRRMSAAWDAVELIDDVFELREYTASDELRIGPFAARFCEVPHYVPSFACELSMEAGRLTFGSDCGPSDALVDFAKDTDLLMLEATLAEPGPEGDTGHMTARQAGEIGRRAGARRLLLTHFSDELDAEWVRSEGEAGFAGQVDLASEGATFTL